MLYEISARVDFKEEYPVVMLIKRGENASQIYNGPKDLESLIEFVNVETGQVPPAEKVCY